ncbi:hypothetical protein ACQ86K_01210 [Mucilaginibacter sp. P19]|uniref:AbiU2 domain-containing protein n=1 Tax=Mucilaginibacter sp. P19 TaxID=3423947 RepID=UPI003D668013
MPSKRALLKEDIEIRWKILIITKEVLKFATYFEMPETRLESVYIRQHRHLSFISWSLWRLAIIELCKLFGDSDNQKFNMLKLLRKVGPAGDYRSLKFNQETLAAFNERANDLSLVIHEINRLRNNLFAHTDSDPFDRTETFITVSECGLLAEFAEEIIRTLADTFLDTDYIANTLYFDSRSFDFIYMLAKAEQDENITIAEQANMSFKELFGYDPL